LEKFAQVLAENQAWALARDEGKAGVDPSADAALAHVQKLCGFRDFVAPMDFDAAEVVPPRHASPAVFDERANVLDAPGGNPGAEFDRFGEAAILDARPPCRTAYRNGSIRRKDGANTKGPPF
jgi:hypothetical protein